MDIKGLLILALASVLLYFLLIKPALSLPIQNPNAGAVERVKFWWNGGHQTAKKWLCVFAGLALGLSARWLLGIF